MPLTPKHRRRLVFETLEPRVLLAADALGAAVQGLRTDADPTPHYQAVASVQQAAVQQTLQAAHGDAAGVELVVIDAAVDAQDRQALLDDLSAQAQAGRALSWIQLDAQRDPIAQISLALADADAPVTAVHLVSHGQAGALMLGDVRLDADALPAYQQALQAWSAYLADDADLLLYGCDLASDDAGRQLMQTLADWTGADVAASEDLTGAAADQADWDLEAEIGEIETLDLLTDATQQQWLEPLALASTTPTAPLQVNAVSSGSRDLSSSSRGSQNAIAVDPVTGLGVVAWTEGSPTGPTTVWARRLAADGSTLGAAFQLDDAQFDVNEHVQVAMVPGSGGTRFVAAWEMNGSLDRDDAGIRARVWDTSLNTQMDVIAVNAMSSGSQQNPSLGVAQDGSFVIAWENLNDGDAGIWVRQFDADGVPIQDQETDVALDGQLLAVGAGGVAIGNEGAVFRNAAVAVAPDGQFAVVFDRLGSLQSSLQMRRYDALGSALGGTPTTIDVVAGSASEGFESAIAARADGSWVLAWTTPSHTKLYRAVYNAGGSVLAPAQEVWSATAPGRLDSVSVDAASNGEFVLVFAHNHSGSVANVGIYAQTFDAQGDSVGASVSMAQGTVANPSVSMPSQGEIAVVWQQSQTSGPTTTQQILVSRVGSSAPILTAAAPLTNGVFETTLAEAQVSGANLDFQATSVSGGTLTWSLVATANNDASRFQIDAVTGVLSLYQTIPTGDSTASGVPVDFETPVDRNQDNTYEVTVRVTDSSTSRATDLPVKVAVQNMSTRAWVDTAEDLIDSGVQANNPLHTIEWLNTVARQTGDGKISLREAMLAANNAALGVAATNNRIAFDLPDGPDADTAPDAIVLAANQPLPGLIRPVQIDGLLERPTSNDPAAEPVSPLSQALYTSPRVVIDGTYAGELESGFEFRPTSSDSLLRGVSIRNFDGIGLVGFGADRLDIVSNEFVNNRRAIMLNDGWVVLPDNSSAWHIDFVSLDVAARINRYVGIGNLPIDFALGQSIGTISPNDGELYYELANYGTDHPLLTETPASVRRTDAMTVVVDGVVGLSTGNFYNFNGALVDFYQIIPAQSGQPGVAEYLGSAVAGTGGRFSATLNLPDNGALQYLSAIATTDHNTSEFANPVVIQLPPVLTLAPGVTTLSGTEDLPLALPAITISDLNGGSATMTLRAQLGASLDLGGSFLRNTTALTELGLTATDLGAGVLSVAGPVQAIAQALPLIQYQAPANYSGSGQLTVNVTDSTGLSSQRVLGLSLANVVEPPSFAAAQLTLNGLEYTTAVGTVTATDPDAQTLTYSIIGVDELPDGNKFSIDSNTGALSFNAGDVPDFDAPADADKDNRYQLRVQVIDGDGARVSVDLTVVVQPNILWVTSLADTTPRNLSVAALTASPGAGITLREALIAANNTAGLDRIYFDLPGDALQTITLGSSALPDITSQVIIDGTMGRVLDNGAWRIGVREGTVNTADVGTNAQLIVELNGGRRGPNGNAGPDDAGWSGLRLSAGSGGSTIRGLIIQGFDSAGLRIASNNNVIAGNFIGVGQDGKTGLGNGERGILMMNADFNQIGSSDRADRNLISNNGDSSAYGGPTSGGSAQWSGISLYNGSSNNVIAGNLIGVDLDGNVATGLGNTDSALYIYNNSSNNTIGGEDAGAGNWLAGNARSAVRFESFGTASTGNRILGNAIYGNGQSGLNLGGANLADGALSTLSANMGMDRPVITDSRLFEDNGVLKLSVSGRIGNNAAGTTFAGATVEVFATDPTDSDAAGEGRYFLGRFTVTGGSNAFVEQVVTLTVWDPTSARYKPVDGVSLPPWAATTKLTATATLAGAGTSDFSSNVVLSTPPKFEPVLGLGAFEGVTSMPVPGLRVTDPVGDLVSVVLQVDSGTLSAPGASAALTVTVAPNGNGSVLTIQKPADTLMADIDWQTFINEALSKVEYTPRSSTFNGTVTLTGTATDEAGLSASLTRTILVASVNNPATITNHSGAASVDLPVIETIRDVARLQFTDPDSNDVGYTPALWSLVPGGAADLFEIDTATNILRFKTAPDFEAWRDAGAVPLSVTVRLTDSGTAPDGSRPFVDQTFRVSIVDAASSLIVNTTADSNDLTAANQLDLLAIDQNQVLEWVNARIATVGDGKLSLREAILVANRSSAIDTINFAISSSAGADPSAVQTIGLTSALPAIEDTVVIDGYSQIGAAAADASADPWTTNARLRVAIDGSLAGDNVDGLTLTVGSDGSEVRGLVIQNFHGSGLRILNSSNNRIAGNFIGIQADGVTEGGNGQRGITIESTGSNANNNQIGGAIASQRNVISDNGDVVGSGGIVLIGSGVTQTVVQGNLIGTSAQGLTQTGLGNVRAGVVIRDGSSRNVIGGVEPGQGNVIVSGVDGGVLVENRSAGVTSDFNAIRGNRHLGAGSTLAIDLMQVTEADPAAPGVDALDGVITTGRENGGVDRPTLESVTLDGSTLTVSGWVAMSAPAANADNSPFAGGLIDLYISGGAAGGLGLPASLIATPSQVTVGPNGRFTVTLSNVDAGMFTASTLLTASVTKDQRTSELSANVAVTVIPPNQLPVWSGETAVAVAETLERVTTLQASDPDMGSLQFAISGGADAARFVIVDNTLRWLVDSSNPLPDFENPAHRSVAGASNPALAHTYTVQVDAVDGRGGRSTREFTVTLTDVGSALTIRSQNDAPARVDLNNPLHTAEWLNARFGDTVTLREALIAANNRAGLDTIRVDFSALGAGPHAIKLTDALPVVADAIDLDGRHVEPSSSNASDRVRLVIDGSEINSVAPVDGLVLGGSSGVGGDGSTVRGLQLTGFSGAGLWVRADNNAIADNLLGTLDPSPSSRGNVGAGLVLSQGAAQNNIGGTLAADANIIVNNGGDGVLLSGIGTTGNNIALNYIGTAPDGLTRAGNVGYGIRFANGSNYNRVGAIPADSELVTAPMGNVIAYNGAGGIRVEGPSDGVIAATINRISGNTIQGNTGLAIDLGAQGLSPDNGEGRDGVLNLAAANQGVDRPELLAPRVQLDGTTVVPGFVGPSPAAPGATSPLSGSFVDLYESFGPDGADGQLARWLGRAQVNAQGEFAVVLDPATAASLTGNSVVSAVLIRNLLPFDPRWGNTSEVTPNLPFNDAPSVQVPWANDQFTEDQPIALADLSVLDPNFNARSVVLMVDSGRLSFNGDDLDLSGVDMDPSGADRSVTLTVLGDGEAMHARLQGLLQALVWTPDPDSEASLHLTGSIEDALGAIAEINKTITRLALPDAPVIVAPELPVEVGAVTVSIDENASVADALTRFIASDPDSNEELAWTLPEGVMDNARFRIDEQTGEVWLQESPDAEAFGSRDLPQYQAVVRVTDRTGLFAERSLIVTVNPLNDNGVTVPVLVTDVNATVVNVREDAVAEQTVLMQVRAFDADGDAVRFRLETGSDRRLVIDDITGAVRLSSGSAFDYEGVDFERPINVIVTATSINSTQTRTFQLNVVNVDEGGPTLVDGSLLFDERSAPADQPLELFRVRATDPDWRTDAISYALIGDTSGLFEVVTQPEGGAVVRLLAGRALDFEAAQQHVLVIRATSTGEGRFVDARYTLNLSNLDDNALVLVGDVNPADNVVRERVEAGASVGIDLDASDADVGAQIRYALLDSADGRFTIDDQGVVRLAEQGRLDFEEVDSRVFTLLAQVTSGDRQRTLELTVRVLDEDEFDVGAVADADAADNGWLEGSAAGSAVGITAQAQDRDGSNNTVSYQLSVNPQGIFGIDEVTGVVTVVRPELIDYDQGARSYRIEVLARSTDNSEQRQGFDITIRDRNEGPQGQLVVGAEVVNTLTVSQYPPFGAQLGRVLGTDPENNTLSYSLVGAAQGFAIDARTGVITVTERTLRDTGSALSLHVQLSDGSNTSLLQVPVQVVSAGSVSALDFTVQAVEDQPLTVNILSRLFDAGVTDAAVVRVSGAQQGVASLGSNGLLQYQPQPNFNGQEQIRYEIRTPWGATATGVIRVSVDAVNDLPTPVAPAMLSTLAGSAVALRAANFPLADIESDALQVIEITSLPVAGSVQLRGVPVQLGQRIGVAELNASHLQYVAPQGLAESLTTGFSYRVGDRSAAGSALSDGVQQLQIAIAAVASGGFSSPVTVSFGDQAAAMVNGAGSGSTAVGSAVSAVSGSSSGGSQVTSSSSGSSSTQASGSGGSAGSAAPGSVAVAGALQQGAIAPASGSGAGGSTPGSAASSKGGSYARVEAGEGVLNVSAPAAMAAPIETPHFQITSVAAELSIGKLLAASGQASQTAQQGADAQRGWVDGVHINLNLLNSKLQGALSQPQLWAPSKFEAQKSETQTNRSSSGVSYRSETNYRQFDQLRQQVTDKADATRIQSVVSSVAVSGGMSVGYVIWLLRGGVLASTMLSSLPAWRSIDPLPVLRRAGGLEGEDDDGDSLESLVATGDADDGMAAGLGVPPADTPQAVPRPWMLKAAGALGWGASSA